MLHDLRYALRLIRNAPVASAIAILTVAIGVGAHTAIFSVVRAVFGLAPAVGAARRPLVETIRDGTPGMSGGRGDDGADIFQRNQSDRPTDFSEARANAAGCLGARRSLDHRGSDCRRRHLAVRARNPGWGVCRARAAAETEPRSRGARSSNLLRLVLGQAAIAIMLGLAIGLAAALAANRVIATFLFGVVPSDPLTLASVAGLLTVVAAVACYLPARQAVNVDPLVALKSE